MVTYHLCYVILRILIPRVPEPNKYTMEAAAVPSQAICSYHYLLPLNLRFPVYAFESRKSVPFAWYGDLGYLNMLVTKRLKYQLNIQILEIYSHWKSTKKFTKQVTT